MTKCIAIIPARYGSSRLPGKPLLKIGDMTMIERVYRQVRSARKIDRIIIATDDQRIADHVADFDAEVAMTFRSHQSGTDRCAEVARDFWQDDVVINVQGDEPFIDPELIDELAQRMLDDDWIQIATLRSPIRTDDTLADKNTVKLVCSKSDRALYFSRREIPFQLTDNFREDLYYKHIGLYAYRNKVLQEITSLQPTALEVAERLEQLRWLENDYTIHVFDSRYDSFGVDSPEDLEKARRFIGN